MESGGYHERNYFTLKIVTPGWCSERQIGWTTFQESAGSQIESMVQIFGTDFIRKTIEKHGTKRRELHHSNVDVLNV